LTLRHWANWIKNWNFQVSQEISTLFWASFLLLFSFSVPNAGLQKHYKNLFTNMMDYKKLKKSCGWQFSHSKSPQIWSFNLARSEVIKETHHLWCVAS
jgi:hypothetical protein